jgi:hypothetical protein
MRSSSADITLSGKNDSLAARSAAGRRRNVDLNHIESDDTSPAHDINFDPLVLPNEIELFCRNSLNNRML